MSIIDYFKCMFGQIVFYDILQYLKMLNSRTKERNCPEKPKEKLFRLFHHLIDEYSVPHQLYLILLTIEAFQIMGYIICSSYESIWEIQIIRSFSQALGYFTFAAVFQQVKSIGVIAGGLILLIINLIGLMLIIHDIYFSNYFPITEFTTLKARRVSSIKLKYLQYLYALSKTILTIPTISLTIGWISEAQPLKNSALHYAALIISLFAIITHFIILGLSLLLGTDHSPFSKLPISGRLTQNEVIKNLGKITMGFFGIFIEWQKNNTSSNLHFVLFNFFIIGILAYLLIDAYNQVYIDNLNSWIVFASKTYIFFIVNLLWLSLSIILNYFVTPSNNNVDLIFFGIGFVLTNLIWGKLKTYHENKSMFSDFDGILDTKSVLNYIIYCISFVHGLEDRPEAVIKLEGILSMHIQSCRKSQAACNCGKLREQIKETYLKAERLGISKSHLSNGNEEQQGPMNFTSQIFRSKKREEKKSWYDFIKNCILVKIQVENHHDFNLMIYLAFLERLIFGNNFKALRFIEKCQSSGTNHFLAQKKNSLVQEFLIYREKRDVEQVMKEEDVRINEKSLINVNSFYEFEISFNDFVRLVKDSSVKMLEFWLNQEGRTKKALNESIDQAYQIRLNMQKIKKSYRKLTEMNPKNIGVLALFSSFCKFILNDPKAQKQNKEKIEKLREEFARSPKYTTGQLEKDKYSHNSKTAIIIISGNRFDLGIIKHCTEKVTELYKYSTYEMIGQSINMIMPPSISNNHNDVLLNFLEKGKTNLGNIERIGPVLDKNKFLVVSQVLFKPIPNLLDGLQMLGIMNQIKEYHPRHGLQRPSYIFYREDTDKIEGVSQNFYKNYGHQIQSVSQTSEIKEDLYFGTLFNVKKDYRTQKFIADIQDNGKGVLAKITLKKNKKVQEVRLYLKQAAHLYGLHFRIISVYSQKMDKIQMNVLNFEHEDSKKANALYSENDLEQKVGGQNSLGNKQLKLDENFLQNSINRQLKSQDDVPPPKIKILKITILLQLFILLFLMMIKMVIHFHDLDNQTMMREYYLKNSDLTINAIDMSYFSVLTHIAASNQNSLSFLQMRNNITEISKSLQNLEFWLVNNEPKLKVINFQAYNTAEMIKNWEAREDTSIISKEQTISLSVFDLVTSASIFNSAQIDDFDYPLQLQDANTSAFSKSIFKSEFHIRYTSLFELISKKLVYSTLLFDHFIDVQENSNLTMKIVLICTGIYLVIVLIFLSLFLSKLLQHIKNFALQFTSMHRPDFSQQILICSRFLSIFFSSSYQIIIRNKAKFKVGTSFDENGFLNSRASKLLQTQTMMHENEEGEEEGDDCASEYSYKLSSKKIETQINQILSKSICDIEDKDSKKKKGSTIMGQNGEFEEKSPFLRKIDDEEIYTVDQFKSMKKRFLLVFIGFVALLFMGSLIFLVERLLYENTFVEKFAQLRTIANNIIFLKAFKLYSLESALEDNKFDSYAPLSDYFQNYTSLLYQQQRLFDEISNNGESQSTIGQTIFKMNTENACSNLFTDSLLIFPVKSMSRQECQNIENGVLSKGLRLAIVSFIEKSIRLLESSKIAQSLEGDVLLNRLKLEKYILNNLAIAQENLQVEISESIAEQIKLVGISVGLYLPIAILISLWVYNWLSTVLMKKIFGAIQLISQIPVFFMNKKPDQFKQCDQYLKEMLG